MEVDPAPGSLASQPEQEEKKFEEPMAHEKKDEEVAPSIQSHQVLPPVLPQQAGEVFVPPPQIAQSPKEKDLETEYEKAAEGVPVKEIEGQTSAPTPSAP